MNICKLECDRKIYSRGLCNSHYNKYRNDGTLDSVADPTKHPVKHILSDVDEATRIGTCSVCGDGTPCFARKADGIWRCTLKRRKDESEAFLRKPKELRAKSQMTYRYGEGETIVRADARAAREKFYVEQDSRCAICNRSEDEDGRSLHLDHCHSNGTLRGLLCSRCNTGLGMFGDSVETLKAASDYLTAFKVL